MKKMKKSLLVSLLSVSMVAAVFGTPVYAEETEFIQAEETIQPEETVNAAEETVETAQISETFNKTEEVEAKSQNEQLETEENITEETCEETEFVDETEIETAEETQEDEKSSDEVISFKDANLKQALLRYDSNGDGNITKGELAAVTYLYLDEKNISNLSGIEYAVNAKELFMAHNPNLQDIRPLFKLTKLQSINAFDCDILDISGIENMKSLVTVDFRLSEKLSNIKPLFKVNSLQAIYLECNDIQDITGIEQLTHLTKIHIRFNEKLSDIRSLYNISELTEIDLYGCNVSNLKGIEKLKSLQVIDLSSNKNLTDISPLYDLPELETVIADNCRILSVKGIDRMKKLQSIDLAFSDNLDISPLFGVSQLVRIGASGCAISNLNGIEKMDSLRAIDLSYNSNLSDISPLKKLKKLEYCGLQGTSVSEKDMLSLAGYGDKEMMSGNRESLFKVQVTPAAAITLLDGSEYVSYNNEHYVTANKEGIAHLRLSYETANKDITIKVVPKKYDTGAQSFTARLYNVCLNRDPDGSGLDTWSGLLESKQMTGTEVAKGFVFSNEFKAKNLCNEDYVEQLYEAFMGRKADAAGKSTWVNLLESGTTREEVFNGFALSKEFEGLCDQYGIEQGKGIEVPKYGTIPTDSCSICGKEDGVTSFVTRLYQVCLNRKPDESGLTDWRAHLGEHISSGREVAYGFIFSQEFINKKYSNADYVEHLYEAFMGRGSDAAGKKMWVDLLNTGWTREQVFDGFVGSQEFTGICNSYGIVRD